MHGALRDGAKTTGMAHPAQERLSCVPIRGTAHIRCGTLQRPAQRGPPRPIPSSLNVPSDVRVSAAGEGPFDCGAVVGSAGACAWAARWRRRSRAAALGLLLALGLGGTPAPAAAESPPDVPVPRFRTPAALTTLGAQVLSAEEQAYIARLPEIRVAVPRPPSRPYELLADDGTVGGIHPEMLVYLAQAFGLKIRPVIMPDWSSTLEAAKRREVDLLMTLGVTAERSEYLAFTLGATPLPGALFGRTGAGPVAPASPAPATATFALERAYMANDFVKRQFPQARIVTVDDTGQALAAVAQGRADYYLGSMLEALDWLARDPQPQVQVQQLMNYGTGYYHFAVRKDWAPLTTILNKGIANLRATPPAELTAAMAALSDRMVLPQPVVLGPGDASRLIEKPIWRIGALRGMSMLNDVSGDGQHTGIGAEYAEQVAQQLGVGLHVVPFDSAAPMLEALRRGHIDLVPFLTRTPERERDFRFSRPYASMPYMLVARSDAPLYWGLSSLRGKRLALTVAHPLRPLLAEQYPDIEIVTTSSGQQAMDAVAEGLADAAVEVKLFANLRINGDNDGRLRAVAEVNELSAQFQFAAGSQAAGLIPIVDRALQQIPAGEHERIMRRWVALDLQPGFPWRRYAPLLALAAAAALLLAGGTVFWMRRLQREVDHRRRSEERLADIGATLPCVAFRYVLHPQKGVQGSGYYSEGASELLGEALDPSLSLLDNLAPRLRREHLAAARALEQVSVDSGERLCFLGAFTRVDGGERWLRVEAVSKPGSEGATAWTGYVVDVTAERELQQRVEREAQSRNLMLASASHELRAPTHTLSLALQALASERDPAVPGEPLRVAQDAVRNLGQLLNDVLDAARMDRGELRLRPQVFDLRELVGHLQREVQAWAYRKGLGFRAHVEPEVPTSLQLDPLRLRQILTNLLSNAIKYTAVGEVSLAVRVSPGSAAAGGGPLTLDFHVIDTGPGIAPDRQPLLFAPYASADSSEAPVPEGSSGLGLNISRRLADLMGGDLVLDSAPGRGTRVLLRLPVPALGTLPAAAPPRPASAEDEGAVLLCEDDPTCLLLMGQMLRAHGHRVIECRSGREALAVWRAGGVCAIVTDLQMGDADDMDGMSLVVRVRQDMQARRIPLILCSGNPVPVQEPGDEAPAYDAWLTKPVQMSVLIQTLAELGVRPPAKAEGHLVSGG